MDNEGTGGRPAKSGAAAGLWQVSGQLLSALNGVAPATQKELTSAAVMLELPADAVIYDVGDRCIGLYVIVSGRVKLTKGSVRSKSRALALLGPDTWFDETPFLMRERHALGARTAERAVIARINTGTVVRLLNTDHTFAIKMLTETARLLHSFHGR